MVFMYTLISIINSLFFFTCVILNAPLRLLYMYMVFVFLALATACHPSFLSLKVTYLLMLYSFSEIVG